MSSDKLPSALNISQHQQSSPRGLGGSILQSKKIPDSQPSLQVLPNPTTSASPQGYSTTPQYAYSSDNTGYMNSQGNSSYGALEYSHQHHLSQGQPSTPQTATSGGGLSSFPPQPPILQPTYQQQPTHAVFPQFSFPSSNGVSSPAGQPGVSGPMSVHANQQLLPLPPSMTPNHSPLASVSAGGQQTPSSTTAGAYNTQPFDTTGQMAPAGMKPRVAATLWEDEGSLCFQVEARGVCVARREDNHMINGTKLLNVAGMTRGRRDGILKSEKVRHVVKIGPMHLKGVWIPFERALDFANKEKITELLYPLFVHNIGAFLYHPTNTHRTSAVMAAAERRRADSSVLSQSQALNQGSIQRRGQSDLISPSQPPPLHAGMHNPIHAPLPPHGNLAQPRPGLERSMSFPTPPSSASSVMGGVNGDGSSFGWNGNMVSNVGGPNNQPLALDTLNSRSMPTTPATTPPGGLQQLQQYPPPTSSIYQQNGPGGMSQQSIAQSNMQRFNQPPPQPSTYMSQARDSNTMGPPPTSRGPPQVLSRPSSRQEDAHVKDDGEEQNGLVEEHGAQDVHGDEDGDNEGDHNQEEEYTTHDGNYANGHRPYYPTPLANAEHTPHLSPDMAGSPGHVQGPSTPARSSYGSTNVSVPRTVDNATGATPRTTTTPQQQWVQNSSGYQTPPRTNSSNGPTRQPPQRNIYQLVTGDPAADHCDVNGAGSSDGTYAGQPLGGVAMPPQVPPQNYASINGTPGSSKRLREVDDDDEHGSRPSSRGHEDRTGETEVTGLKRRKTIREGSTPSTGMGSGFDRHTENRHNRTRSAAVPRGRR
ncbi:hypothetical protein EDC01DRAFT_451091 [Geopyxis carbonaria]|nr:hypothetical protein EDC01DRAFT_451091 [Geopyxis carbonaria]